MTVSHIYRARDQPATHYRVDLGDKRSIWIETPGNALAYCFRCRKRRPAKNLIVHVYYDDVRFYCMTGKGCRRR